MDSTKKFPDIFIPSATAQNLDLHTGGITQEVLLGIMKDRINDPAASPGDKILALVAEQLIRLKITGDGAVQLAYSIAGVTSRISRVPQVRTEEAEAAERKRRKKEGSGDPALAHLYMQMSRASSPNHRALLACQLGDSSLQYAARFGGIHLGRVMKNNERLRYCEGMARTSYQLAADLGHQYPSYVSPWIRETAPHLAGNISTSRAVISGIRDPQHQDSSPSVDALIIPFSSFEA